jgi:hypothetical protein
VGSINIQYLTMILGEMGVCLLAVSICNEAKY